VTLAEWLPMAARRLSDAGVDEARLDSQLIAAHVLRSNRTFVLTHPDHEINELAAESLIQRREAREPLPYILGYREFYGRRFTVTPAVLIPRPETEHIVEVALRLPLPADGQVLDVGTGSGILAVTLATERPEWRVTGTDLSPTALRIAQRNALDYDAAVRFLAMDGLTGWGEEESFDLIVSNPPYIRAQADLMPEILKFEPSVALYGGETGLELYRRWIPEARLRLRHEGWLLMEIGYDQGPPVACLFREAGFAGVEVMTDLAGIDRVVTGFKPTTA
jgi:release factor glutamine methyltransferase